jgi:hypothetical protein
MAHVTSHHNRNMILVLAGGIVAAALIAMLVFHSGHHGQPSGGEGNPMQTDQGR